MTDQKMHSFLVADQLQIRRWYADYVAVVVAGKIQKIHVHAKGSGGHFKNGRVVKQLIIHSLTVFRPANT